MSVFATGANSFVGSALCLHLAELGLGEVPVYPRQSNAADEVIVHGSAS